MSTRLQSYQIDVGVSVIFVMDCSQCGVIYGIGGEYEERRRDDGKSWQCPNGHSQMFTKSAATKEKERADKAEQRLRWAEAREAAQRRERESAERSAAAYKGHLTRLRNRVAAGVCPVQSCRRNFANVKAHVASQHPDWAHDHPEVLT